MEDRKFLDEERKGNYCGYDYDRFLTSEVHFGPRGEYYQLVLVKDGHIVVFGDEQGNYAGGIYASNKFMTELFLRGKDNLRYRYPELYEKIKDIPLAECTDDLDDELDLGKIQIATSKKQSLRMLSCGINDETADMYFQENFIVNGRNVGRLHAIPYKQVKSLSNKELYPAWSLSVLL